MFLHRSQTVESEAALHERAGNWPHHATLESLTAETLQELTKTQGVDFATALLFDRFQRDPKQGAFIRRTNLLRQSSSPARGAIKAKVVIVPGALYMERPDIGGDG